MEPTPVPESSTSTTAPARTASPVTSPPRVGAVVQSIGGSASGVSNADAAATASANASTPPQFRTHAEQQRIDEDVRRRTGQEPTAVPSHVTIIGAAPTTE